MAPLKPVTWLAHCSGVDEESECSNIVTYEKPTFYYQVIKRSPMAFYRDVAELDL